MFGYVTVYKPELKMKDFYKYRAYYCGLCKTLRKNYGHLGQMTLTYDMTFLIILLTSLYETHTEHEQCRCIVHPVKRHDLLVNEFTEYAADMNIVMTYYHFLDDWQDEKKPSGFAGVKALHRDFVKISEKYPRQSAVIKKYLRRLRHYEKDSVSNIDLVSGCFWALMGELMIYRKDRWERTLRRTGFFLGKFIFIIDAYEDMEKDTKNNSYNLLRPLLEHENYETECRNILTMMMAECTGEFEQLPCVLDVDILRNILYAGVWTKFDALQTENNKKEELKK